MKLTKRQKIITAAILLIVGLTLLGVGIYLLETRYSDCNTVKCKITINETLCNVTYDDITCLCEYKDSDRIVSIIMDDLCFINKNNENQCPPYLTRDKCERLVSSTCGALGIVFGIIMSVGGIGVLIIETIVL